MLSNFRVLKCRVLNKSWQLLPNGHGCGLLNSKIAPEMLDIFTTKEVIEQHSKTKDGKDGVISP